MNQNFLGITAALLIVSLAFAGCTGGSGDTYTLTGAGATFANPIISVWSEEYLAETGNRINYNSIGSGGGIRAHTDKTVYFGASEAPLNKEQEANAPNTLTLPFTIGSVAMTYNLAGVENLRLTGPVIADIYLGKITRWNDQRITAINPGVNLPDAQVNVAHRSDGSGTTFVFTDYLSKVSQEWKDNVGSATSVQWPVGVGGNGNEGVAGVVRNSANSIGYVELGYVISTGMKAAPVQNSAGNYVAASLDAASAASAGAISSLPGGDASWFGVSFTNAPGAQSYPISSFSYFFIYKDLATLGVTKEEAQAIVDWMKWAVTDGQEFNNEVNQASIPAPVQQLNLNTLRKATWNGETLRV